MQRTCARTEIHTPSRAIANIIICYQFYSYFSAYNYTLLHVLQYWSVINVLTQHTCICLCKYFSSQMSTFLRTPIDFYWVFFFYNSQISTFPQNPWTSILMNIYEIFQCNNEAYSMFMKLFPITPYGRPWIFSLSSNIYLSTKSMDFNTDH